MLAAGATPSAAEVRDEKADWGIRGGGNQLPDLLAVETMAEHKSVDVGPGNRSNARPEVKANKPNAVPNTRRNARQIPEEKLRAFDALIDQIPDQMPEQFDQSTGWEDLWRIEKDGETRYRWRLRFTADRRGRPGGKITPAIRRKLKRRPGKGRHADSRQAAERFRRRAELIAERLRASNHRRALGKNNGADGDERSNTRANDPALEREQMPGVRELDNWPEMPDVLM